MERLEKKIDTLIGEIRDLRRTIKVFMKKEMTLKEAATFLNLEPKTIHNLISSRKLQGFKRGKFRYFTHEEIIEYDRQRKQFQ